MIERASWTGKSWALPSQRAGHEPIIDWYCGRILERPISFAMIYAGGRSAAAAVVFAAEGDLVLLGAHGLEGLKVQVDLTRKELVPAGPVPAAAGI